MAAQRQSRSRARAQRSKLVEEKCLLFMARRQGPAIDQIDVVGDGGEFTRDVLAGLVDEDVGSPAELRVALEGLMESGATCYLGDRELYTRHSRIGLTARGLMLAREIEPDVGMPETLRLVLRSSKTPSRFAARFETGSKERNRELNAGGVALACFYLLAIEKPRPEAPVTLEWFGERLPALAALGVGPKRGPGSRLTTSRDTITRNLTLLQTIFRGSLHLASAEDGGDQRVRRWSLTGPFPEVRMMVPRSRHEERSWDVFLPLLRQAFAEQLAELGKRRPASR